MSDDKIKVLFVDDEEELRKACDRLLTNRGYFTRTAENGQVALEMMSQNPFDVVILDLKMPIILFVSSIRIYQSLSLRVTVPFVRLSNA